MKSQSFNTTLTAGLLAVTLGFTACNQEGNKTSNAQQGQSDSTIVQSAQASVIEVPDFTAADNNFRGQLENVYGQYLKLKDGLVETNLENTKKAAQALLEELAQIDAKLLSTEQKAFFNKHASEIKQDAQTVTRAGSVKEQRAQLDSLSASTFSLVKAFGVNDQPAYYQYCPMANNDQGAYWISQEPDIKNPVTTQVVFLKTLK